jgi:hypothetical protein
MMTGERTRFPLGAVGVAGAAALLGAVAGLIVPMGWIEEAAFQLYLDRLIPAAVAPLGLTARLATAAALALGLGLLGWLVATWLRVQPSDFTFAGWLARLRGTHEADEADAPPLRAADRHPDAPARRPFSAARDVPTDEAVIAAPAAGWDDLADDELLLDAHFDEAVSPAVVDETVREARWAELADDMAPPPAAVQSEPADLPRDDDTDQPILVPAPESVRSEAQLAETATAPEHAAAPMAASMPGVLPPAAPEPLDLSIARLDELIARLESSLGRREAPRTGAASASAPAADRAAEPAADAAPAPVLQDDGDVLHDPALAAALATLRRMNRTS